MFVSSVCASDWVIYPALSSSLLVLSSALYILLLSPSLEFSILLIVFFSSETPFGSVDLLFLGWDFLFFCVFQGCPVSCWIIFMISTFKSLSQKSSFCVSIGIWSWDFPASWYNEWFWNYLGHHGVLYYETNRKIQYIFCFSSSLTLHCLVTSRVGWKSRFLIQPPLTSPVLCLVDVGFSGSLLSLSWLSWWEGRQVLHLDGMEVQDPHFSPHGCTVRWGDAKDLLGRAWCGREWRLAAWSWLMGVKVGFFHDVFCWSRCLLCKSFRSCYAAPFLVLWLEKAGFPGP